MLLLLTEVQGSPDSNCSIIFLSSSFLMRSWEILLLRFFHLARSWCHRMYRAEKNIPMHLEEKANGQSKYARGWNGDTYVLPVVFLLLHLVVLIVHQFMTHLIVGLQESLLLRTHVDHTHTPAERQAQHAGCKELDWTCCAFNKVPVTLYHLHLWWVI